MSMGNAAQPGGQARSAACNRRSVGRCGRGTADPPTWTNVATEAELVITKAKSETAYLPDRPVVHSLSSTPRVPPEYLVRLSACQIRVKTTSGISMNGSQSMYST